MMRVWSDGGVARVRKSRQKEAAGVCGGRGFMGIECGGTREAVEVAVGSLFASNVNLGLGRTLKKTALVDLERSDLRFQSRRWNAQSGSCAGCS